MTARTVVVIISRQFTSPTLSISLNTMGRLLSTFSCLFLHNQTLQTSILKLLRKSALFWSPIFLKFKCREGETSRFVDLIVSVLLLPNTPLLGVLLCTTEVNQTVTPIVMRFS